MTTLREVQIAIARCEDKTTNPLDRTQVLVERGALTTLLEAARAAKYRNIGKPFETKEFVLDDGSPIIRGA